MFPKVATKSLPKEIISKIQILDTKTKEQKFTVDVGTGETKTINLTIKEDKNKGYLGRLSGGYGTDERYQANGLLNYFNDSERISVIGASNNINNAGFSFDEIYDMLGRTRGGVSINNQSGTISPRISTSFNIRETFQFEPEYSISFGSAKYNLDGLTDIDYISHRLNLKTTSYWPKNIIWGNDLNNSYNNNVGPGFDKDALFWNMSLGYEFLKKKCND